MISPATNTYGGAAVIKKKNTIQWGQVISQILGSECFFMLSKTFSFTAVPWASPSVTLQVFRDLEMPTVLCCHFFSGGILIFLYTAWGITFVHMNF